MITVTGDDIKNKILEYILISLFLNTVLFKSSLKWSSLPNKLRKLIQNIHDYGYGRRIIY
jgi:hypothetical protein